MIDVVTKKRADDISSKAEERTRLAVESKGNPALSRGESSVSNISGSYADTSMRTVALSGDTLNDVISTIKGKDGTLSSEEQYVNDYSTSVQHSYDTYSFSFVIGKDGDYISPLTSDYDLFVCGSEQFQEMLRVFVQYSNGGIKSVELGTVSKGNPLQASLPSEVRMYPWILLFCAESSSEIISASQESVNDPTCKSFTNYISQIHLIKRG